MQRMHPALFVALILPGVLVLSGCASASTGTTASDGPVRTWPPILPANGTIEACIQYSMDLVGVDDPAELTAVDCLNMETLEGVEHLTDLPGLTELRLRGGPALSDLTPLAELADLTTLTTLILSDSPALTDLTPLEEMTNLTYLEVSGSPSLTDLSWPS